jgi:ABC-type transport system involved in multi-copper enzyme maturation permease subunit
MLLQGSISIYVSVRAPNSLRAMVNAYLQSLAAGAFCGLCLFFLLYWSLYSSPSPWETMYLLTVPGGFIGFFFVAFAIVRLRRSVQFEPRPVPPRGWDSILDRPVRKEVLRLQWLAQDFYRSPITDPPILWKDFHRRRRDNLPRLIAAVAICFYFYVCLLILATTSESTRGVRTLAPWAICILLFPAAITSARMVSQEKEKRTLDSLLVTDLDAGEVLFHKWWASALFMRWVLAIQAVVLGMAGLGGVLHPLAAVYLLGATIVYTCFVVSLGLLVSTLCDTVLKSTMISVAALIVFVFAGPLGLVSPSTDPRNLTEWWFQDVMSYAFSPIDTLRCLAFDWVEWQRGSLQAWQIVAALSAVGLVALASWGLWKLTLLSFERGVKGPAPRVHY